MLSFSTLSTNLPRNLTWTEGEGRLISPAGSIRLNHFGPLAWWIAVGLAGEAP